MQRYFGHLTQTGLSLALVLVTLRGALAQNSATGAPAASSNASAENGSQTGDAASADSGLPADFQLPRDPPPVMTVTKDLMSEAELDQLERTFKAGLISDLRGPDNPENRRVLKDWATVRIYRMALPKHRALKQLPVKAKEIRELEQSDKGLPEPPEQLHSLRDKLMREIVMVGSSIDNDTQRLNYRKFALSEITNRAAELLDNHFQVRLNAVIILSELNLVEPDPRRNTKLRAFVPAAQPLLEVLKAPTSGELDGQKEAVKLHAARGLGHISLAGDPGELTIVLRNEIAEALINELQNKNAHWWYQKELVEALSKVELETNRSGQQFILQTLGDILTDPTRDLLVRAEAAKGLGRVPLPANTHWDTLVYRIAHLGRELADAYQKNPSNYRLPDAFYKLYFAFHPVNPEEISKYAGRQGGGPGLLRKQNAPAVVQAGYQQILPFVQHIVKQPLPTATTTPAPFGDGQLGALTAWLQKNPPTNNKLTPVLPDLNPVGPVKSAAAPGTGGK